MDGPRFGGYIERRSICRWHANGSDKSPVAMRPALTSPHLVKMPLLAALAAGLALVAPAASAQGADGGGSLERQTLAQVNFARTEPSRYAAFLAEFRPHYQGNVLRLPGQRPLLTQEGVRALDEAIHAMRRANPLPPLRASKGLARAAEELAREQSRTGAIGHRGVGGSNPFQRMSRHGRWEAHAGEAIDYGGADARRIVANLIIDDGVRDRGHRLSLLAPDFRVAGVACAPHPRYRRMCVIDFAEGFAEAERTGAAVASGPVSRNLTRRSVRPPATLAAWQRGR